LPTGQCAKTGSEPPVAARTQRRHPLLRPQQRHPLSAVTPSRRQICHHGVTLVHSRS
jgi:hypothetical protein